MPQKVRKVGKLIQKNAIPITVGLTIGAGIAVIYMFSREQALLQGVREGRYWETLRWECFLDENDLYKAWQNYGIQVV